MKERIIKNWNVRRAAYVLLGGVVIVNSIIAREWVGIAFGGYFAAMGIFSFGCAGGCCTNVAERRPGRNIT